MLTQLIQKYGKEKLNSLTKYPSILTLHKPDKKGILTEEFTTDISNETMIATEKIDGTNIRMLYYGGQRIVGSREDLFYFDDSAFLNPQINFFNNVDVVKPLFTKAKWKPEIETETLTVVYGELYGGKTSANAANYGQDKHGFRVFDIAVFPDLSVLDLSLPEISKWRERETESGMIYGQKFLGTDEMRNVFTMFDFVPIFCDFRPIPTLEWSLKNVLRELKCFVSETLVSLQDTATKKAEGMVLRNQNRTKIVKIRFEDYERALRNY